MSKLTCFLGLHRWRITGWTNYKFGEFVEQYEPAQQTCSRCGLKRAYKED